jgi:hypothetical protein
MRQDRSARATPARLSVMSGPLRRLRGRTAAEWRERSAQAASRWLERIGFGDVGEPNAEQLRRLIGEDFAGSFVRGPFFASLADRSGTLQALGTIDPGLETSVRPPADAILAGRYDLLGYTGLAVPQPIDWWRDPLAGVRAPDRHWSRIAFLDPAVAGDHKLVWELSRHRALLTLAQAWWCTEEPRYAAAVNTLLESWMDANPPKRGIHWASSLEIAFRSLAWLWSLALLGDAMPCALGRRALGYLAIGARHIERHLSTWFSPNTHLTGEALGLYALGVALPQCPDATRWRATGDSILRNWVHRHIRDDGTYVEQSTWYHRYTSDFFLHYFVLAGRAGDTDGAAAVKAPLERSLDVLGWITRPDGTFPRIGDDDGGRLLFLDNEPATRVQTTLSAGAALFGRADWAHVAGAATPALVWLLGADGLRQYESLSPAPRPDRSRAFASGGLYVARSGWDAASSLLTIDAGPHGFLNGGHAHADALSLDLTVEGAPLFIDPGTYTYTVSADWRDRFRDTRAHNAATVDGRASAVPSGPFQWASRATARCDAWFDDGQTVLFSGVHDGFEQREAGEAGEAGVAYRRTILYLRTAVWIIRDEIHGAGDHDLAVHWQCHPSVSANVADGAVLLSSDRLRVSMQTAETAAWSVDEGWVSPMYGVREPISRLTALRRGRDVVCLTSMIDAAGGAKIVALESGSSAPVQVTVDGRAGVLLVGGGRFGGLETDAAVTWIELGAAGEPIAVTATSWSRLTLDGVPCPAQASRSGVRWVIDQAVKA